MKPIRHQTEPDYHLREFRRERVTSCTKDLQMRSDNFGAVDERANFPKS